MAKALAILAWFMLLVGTSLLAIKFVPFHASFPYYDTDIAPYYERLAAIPAHFDGIHYLRLAEKGYDDDGSQAFFPLYPMLIRVGTTLGLDPILVGLTINLLALAGLALLLPKRTVVFVLSHPASFFLLTLYTEAFFLFLLALALKLVEREKLALAAIIIALLSATRLVGIVMLVPLILRMWPRIKTLAYLVPVATSGLVTYMLYLWYIFGDPLKFAHVQPLFGAGRVGDSVILLPQVMYRYARMMVTVPTDTWLFWRSVLELFTLVGVGYLLYHFRRRMSRDLWWYSLGVILIPALSGTLSSMPRYILAALPLISVFAESCNSKVYWFTVSFQVTLLVLFTTIFVSGQFVA